LADYLLYNKKRLIYSQFKERKLWEQE